MNAKYRDLGIRDYEPVWRAMQEFTLARGADTADEFWFVEHPPVFTNGLNGRREHLLDTDPIPVVHIDRGGQVTYHGPGQLVVYTLVDLERMKLGVCDFVARLEDVVIEVLADLGVRGERRKGAPGVYVDGAKIAALGLRVKRGRAYHGLSLNVDMDLQPFERIHPCGYEDLPVTQLIDHYPAADNEDIAVRLRERLQHFYQEPTT